MEEETKSVNDILSGFMPSMGSADGSEELLKVVAEYALQLPTLQIQAILKLNDYKNRFEKMGAVTLAKRIDKIISAEAGWLKYKKFNNTGRYVLGALDSYSMGKWIKAGLLNVNVQKK